MEHDGTYAVKLVYHRENGEWKLVREHIDGRIRNKNPQLIARVTAIDLGLACADRPHDPPEVSRHRRDIIPQKHISLLIEAVTKLGLFPRSIHEDFSDGGYSAFVIVESLSPPCLHLG